MVLELATENISFLHACLLVGHLCGEDINEF